MFTRNGFVAWAVAAIMAVSLLTPRSVLAERQDARRHYAKATAAFGLGKYDDAAIEYEAAFQIKPEPALLYNAAQAYRLAGKTPRAVQLYRNYLRLYGDAENADDARQHLVNLESTTVELPAPPVTHPPVSDSLPPRSAAASTPPSTASVPLLLAQPQPPPPTLTERTAELSPPSGATEKSSTASTLATRPIFWVAVGAVILAGGTAWVLSRSKDQDPTASLGTALGN